jgi:hypothetical protein
VVYDKARDEGYKRGLEHAFKVIYERITGNRVWIPRPVEEEPKKGQSSEGDSKPTK